MYPAAQSRIATHHLLLTFGLIGPPAGFVVAIVGATAFLNIPEGIEALIYGLHPIGLALIYAAGLAPALATAGLLVLLQDRSAHLSVILAGLAGFFVTLAYGLIATATTPVPNPVALSLALAGVGTISAAVCIIIARHAPKVLAPSTPAR